MKIQQPNWMKLCDPADIAEALVEATGTLAIECFWSQFDFIMWPKRQFVGVPECSIRSDDSKVFFNVRIW